MERLSVLSPFRPRHSRRRRWAPAGLLTAVCALPSPAQAAAEGYPSGLADRPLTLPAHLFELAAGGAGEYGEMSPGAGHSWTGLPDAQLRYGLTDRLQLSLPLLVTFKIVHGEGGSWEVAILGGLDAVTIGASSVGVLVEMMPTGGAEVWKKVAAHVDLRARLSVDGDYILGARAFGAQLDARAQIDWDVTDVVSLTLGASFFHPWRSLRSPSFDQVEMGGFEHPVVTLRLKPWLDVFPILGLIYRPGLGVASVAGAGGRARW